VTARFRHVDAVARDIVVRVLQRPPTLGAGRLVCVDGPAGSGKTTLAAALGRELREALRVPGGPADRAHVRTVHMDNVFAGWSGLDDGMSTIALDVIGPLTAGQPGRYRRYDWHRQVFAEERVVEPCEVLVIEGVGSGSTAYHEAITCLVWIDTPPDVRLTRGLERDGDHVWEHWRAWRQQEEAMFVRERTRERADLVIDGTRGAAT
jgi:uridine kinase